jgi:hypothetical protein
VNGVLNRPERGKSRIRLQRFKSARTEDPELGTEASSFLLEYSRIRVQGLWVIV